MGLGSWKVGLRRGVNQGWFDCGRLFHSIPFRSIPFIPFIIHSIPFHSMTWAIDPHPIIRFPMTKYLFEISIRQLRKILANGKHEKRCHKDL